MGLSSRLTNRIDVYGKIKIENELGETDYKYEKLKTIWAEIMPESGNVQSGEGKTEYANINYKFVIRSSALSELSNDMYFVFKGQRYDIQYFNPNYKYRNCIEIFCKLVIEK